MNKTKLTIFYVMILSLLVVSTGCGSLSLKDDKPKEVILKAADVHPDNYPTTKSTKYLAELLEERSNGRIKLQLYPGGQLGEGKTIDDAMAEGIIDIDREGIDRYSKDVKMVQAFMMPYVFRDSAHEWKVLEGPIGDRLKEELKNNDKIVLAFYDSGMRSFYSKKPIHTPEDMKGMKFRTLSGDVFKNMLEIVNAEGMNLAYNDIYPGLQIGKIDGAENNIPSYLTAKHFEIAKYYTLDEHLAIPEILFISKQAWEKLSPDDQKLLLECGAEAGKYQRKLWAEFTQEGIEELKSQGVEFITPDKAAFRNEMNSLYQKYPDSLALIKEIQAVN
jgi:tripartite ATP-independent transporter DctP family solute receptor